MKWLTLASILALAGCQSQGASPLVGEWKLSNRMREENYVFKSDGSYSVTFKVGTQAPGQTIEGTYQMLTPGSIQFFYQGKPAAKETVRVEKDAIWMQRGGNWLEFKRAAP